MCVYLSSVAKLSSKKRRSLPGSSFGQPAKRKYPMPDKAHAANAKARATQQYKRGKLSASERAAINAKANAKLGSKSRSRKKR
jgi:hypothetical protein